MSTSRQPLPVLSVGLALTALATGLSISGCAPGKEPSVTKSVVTAGPWFAGYVDITVPSSYEIDHPPTAEAKNVVLSFIVADPDEPCTPSWGGYYSMDEADGRLSLTSRIAQLRNEGGEVVISFGGQLDDELGTVCRKKSDLATAYGSVIERYGVSTIDLDIEGDDLDDEQAGIRRAEVIAQLQQAHEGENPLRVWVTLPVTPAGLTDHGVPAVRQMLEAGVELTGVNIMIMNYGGSRAPGQTMLDASIAAAHATHGQLETLYQEAGQPLNADQLWHKIGLTPMIGHNDVDGERLDVTAARGLNEFGRSQGIARMSMWSLNRDGPCGTEEAARSRPSNICSGMDQRPGDFARILGAGFAGAIR